MSVETALIRARAGWQTRMRETAEVTRVTGQTWSPVSLTNVDVTVTVYTGPAYFRPLAVGDRDVQAGGREVAIRFYDLLLPWSAVGVEFRRGDRARAVASSDSQLVGRVLTVVGVEYGDQDPYRRLAVEDRS